jgi:hypothetical protein
MLYGITQYIYLVPVNNCGTCTWYLTHIPWSQFMYTIDAWLLDIGKWCIVLSCSMWGVVSGNGYMVMVMTCAALLTALGYIVLGTWYVVHSDT